MFIVIILFVLSIALQLIMLSVYYKKYFFVIDVLRKMQKILKSSEKISIDQLEFNKTVNAQLSLHKKRMLLIETILKKGNKNEVQ